MTTKEKVAAILKDRELVNEFAYLAGRWADERGYETIGDYAPSIDGHLARHGTKVERKQEEVDGGNA